jgi:hypothetical protein
LREIVIEVLINPIIRTRNRHYRHEYHPTRDNINEGHKIAVNKMAFSYTKTLMRSTAATSCTSMCDKRFQIIGRVHHALKYLVTTVIILNVLILALTTVYGLCVIFHARILVKPWSLIGH